MSSSKSPYLVHLLHLTGEELSRITSPKEEVMVLIVQKDTHVFYVSHYQDYVSGAPAGQDKLSKVFNLEVRDAINFIDDL